jgi:polyisoprenoid-binding protein YceI
VAAAVILPPDFECAELNDSKQLSEKDRDKLRPIIQENAIAWAVGIVEVAQIDQINILNASILAMHKAIAALAVVPEFIISDGNRFKPFELIPHQTIVKGDSKFLSIAAAQTKKIDASKSSIHWVGKKVTGSHEGTITLKEGTLIFKGKKLVGGNFTVDMTTINTTDLEGKGKANLDGHLKSDEFFGVEKFPTATLVIKSLGEKGNGVYAVTADLTIKGKTESIKFDLTVGKNAAETSLKVDRTKYGIQYGSGSFFDNLGDKTINDEFELKVKLVF